MLMDDVPNCVEAEGAASISPHFLSGSDLPGHLAAGLVRLSFPQGELERDALVVRWHGEVRRRHRAGLCRGGDEQVPKRWHQHLRALLPCSCHLTLDFDERGNVTLADRRAPPRRFAVTA